MALERVEVNGRSRIHPGYIVALGLMVLMIPSSFLSNTASLYYTPVSEAMGVNLTSYSICSSIQLWVIVFASPLITRFINKVDTKISLTVIVVIQALAYFINSTAQTIWVFYIDAVLLGFAHGTMIFLLPSIMANRWFTKNIGLLLGLIGGCQALGAVIFLNVGAYIIATAGWRMCFVTWAIVTLVVGGSMTLFVIKSRPEKYNLKPVGYNDAAHGDGEGVKLLGISASKARKNGFFWIATTASMCIAASNCFSYFLNAYTLEQGVDTIVAGAASSMIFVGSAIGGKLITGWIQDRAPKVAIWWGAGSAIVAFAILMIFVRDAVWVVFPCFLLYGVSNGATNVISPEFIRSMFGQREYSQIWSTLVIFQTAACAVATIVFGVVVDFVGYSGAMIFVMILVAWTIIGGMLIYTKGTKLKSEWTE